MTNRKKRDTILKNFWKDNEHFADLFNTVLFQGEKVIDPDKLTEKDSDVSDILKMKEHSETMERYRDVIKKNFDGAEYVVYGIENQMSVNYAMPLRNMVYDALGYLQEYEELVRQNRKEKKWTNSAEFLSGLKKTDRLQPVITLVVYYGETPWDGPLSLCDMLEVPDKWKVLVSDYQMHLLQILDTEKYEFQNEDVQTVFEISRHILQKDFQIIQEKYENRYIPSSIGMCIGAITNHKQILRDAEQEGEMNMCRALEELEEKGRMEGRLEERNTILENMIRTGLAAEEIVRYAGVALEEVRQVQKNIAEKMKTVPA